MTTVSARRPAVYLSLDAIPGQAGGVAPALLYDEDMNAVHTKVADWLQIIRGEYLEIPDLALTRAEIQRMWSLDDMTCDALLDALVQTQFLRFTRHQRYVRAGKGNAGT